MGGRMKKIKTYKCPLRLDKKVRRNAKSYADRKNWDLGTLVLNALKSLDALQEHEWERCLPDGWSLNRKREDTSVKFPVVDKKFINEMKNKHSYSFEALMEIALWNYVPSLRKYGKEVCKPKPNTCLYKCTKCFQEEERKTDNEKKVKCKYCKGKALPKNNTKNSYYNWMLKNLMEYIQFGSSQVPDISDIDPKIMKRFFIKKLKKSKKEIEASEKIPKGIHFTPLMQDVYTKWSIDNKVVVNFEGEGVFTGIIYLVRKGKVHIWYGDDWDQEDKTIEEDYDKFSIKSKTTEQGGRILGRVA